MCKETDKDVLGKPSHVRSYVADDFPAPQRLERRYGEVIAPEHQETSISRSIDPKKPVTRIIEISDEELPDESNLEGNNIEESYQSIQSNFIM